MALYNSKGTISHLSDVQSGVSQSGYQWQKLTLVLDVPGYQGTISKQSFNVFGDSVDEVLRYCPGDKVEIKWSMYAREYKGRWYNDVDLVNIRYQEEQRSDIAPAPRPKAYKPQELDPEENDDLPI